jgi:hypothetical protein
MLRMSMAAVLIVLSTSVFAQPMDEMKGIKLGVGCTSPVTQFSRGLATCPAGSRSRVWCPNGQIFERDGEPPRSYVVRSICNLNQIL